jgi:hypothetical protein
MDDQTLTKRIKTLNKAVAAEPPSVVIGMLEELKNDKAPTEDQLRVSPFQPGLLLLGSGGGMLTAATYSPQRPASR